LTVEDSSTPKKESTDVKVKFLDSEDGQKLSAVKIYAYADAISYRRTVGAIYTNER
jgi:hypothetical protein